MRAKEQKCWGERWIIRADSTHTTNLLTLKAGTRCSWHKHEHKWNIFVVIAGRVLVICENEPTDAVLGPGDYLEIAPGVMHEFQVLESGIMLEEMFVEYDDEDIQREIEGGVLTTKHLQQLQEHKGLCVTFDQEKE